MQVPLTNQSTNGSNKKPKPQAQLSKPQPNKRTPDPKGIKRIGVRFCLIVGLIVGSFLLVMSLAVFLYVQTAVAESVPRPAASPSGPRRSGDPAAPAAEPEQGGFIANLMLPPEKTNFLVVGTDAGDALTDVILVGTFDRDTHRITVISVPRDTRISMSKEDVKAMNDVGRYPPSHGVMKINAVNAYGGKTYGIEFLKKQLESMLDITIDYYAVIDLRAFRSIVDAVDGIWMDIPAGGFYSTVEPGDHLSLYINVPGGYQLLDGKKAEQVVRFRGSYAQGDMKRVTIQQEFMKEFFAQVLTKESIIKNLGTFITTMINYVRTDFGIADIPLYLRYVTSLQGDNISFMTLPGHAGYEGEASYFFYDPELTAQMVAEVFYGGTAGEEPEEDAEDAAPAVKTPVTGKRVQVLNGGASEEAVAAIVKKLTAAGVVLVETGQYTSGQEPHTRVLVRAAAEAELFRTYFTNMTSQVNADLSNRFDAVIVVGTAEK